MNPLKLEILPDGISAKLLEDYTATSLGVKVVVPKGFVTDFASVPRFFWRIFPPWGKYSPAAVVHDYLYFTGDLDRCAADHIFLDLMKRCGVPLWKRWTMYRAVRMFGFVAWNNHRKAEREDNA